jgi:hypothetical protein
LHHEGHEEHEVKKFENINFRILRVLRALRGDNPFFSSVSDSYLIVCGLNCGS